jgi:CRP-like cAMP-binding protein
MRDHGVDRQPGGARSCLGPGAVLGERASLDQGRRTATIRAVTDCRVVSCLAADLSPDDLRELAAGHHREDERP